MISISQISHCSVLWWLVAEHIAKMKLTILSIFLALVGVCSCETYTDRYDDINVEEILANRRLLMPYLKCILDQGRCTPEGKELKVHIQDAMQSACAKCTPLQRKKARQVVKHIRQNEEVYWTQMINKYDRDGKYKSTYEPFLESED